MFITRKELQRRINEAVAKEQEKREQQDYLNCRLRVIDDEMSSMHREFQKGIWDIDQRVRKLEGRPEKNCATEVIDHA